MAHPTLSPLAPRKVIVPGMTPAQIKLLKATGLSKQQVVTKGILLVTESDLPLPEDYGSGRKPVKFRLAPEVFSGLTEACSRWDTSQGRVIAGCAAAILLKNCDGSSV